MKKYLITAVASFILIPSIVNAQWLTKTDDDLFSGGKKAMLIGSLNNSSSGIIFDCTSTTLSAAYVEMNKTTDMSGESVPVDLIFKVDSNAAVKMDAKMMRRNDTTVQAFSENAELAKSVLKSLRDGKKKVMVGIQTTDGGNQSSLSGNVSNSTNAVNKFISACEIKL
ncbi:hypothetical protein [Dryocola sp. LX212]|jgi:hypothetical protein